jgi:hypothetical protein
MSPDRQQILAEQSVELTPHPIANPQFVERTVGAAPGGPPLQYVLCNLPYYKGFARIRVVA